MKRFFPLLALASPLVFAFVACSESGSGGTSTGDDPTAESCFAAPLCEKIVLPGYCSSDGESITCAAPDGGIEADAGESDAGDAGGGDAGGLSAVQLARVQCALEALRDRKVGGLALLASDQGSKTCGTRLEIVSAGDGSASVLPVNYCDLDVSRGVAARREIKPASFFEDCLASTDERTRVECLATAIAKTPANGGVCSCRGIHDDPIRGICHEP